MGSLRLDGKIDGIVEERLNSIAHVQKLRGFFALTYRHDLYYFILPVSLSVVPKTST